MPSGPPFLWPATVVTRREPGFLPCLQLATHKSGFFNCCAMLHPPNPLAPVLSFQPDTNLHGMTDAGI